MAFPRIHVDVGHFGDRDGEMNLFGCEGRFVINIRKICLVSLLDLALEIYPSQINFYRKKIFPIIIQSEEKVPDIFYNLFLKPS